MEQLESIRAQIITIYKRYESPVNYVLKFLMGVIIFSSINSFFTSLGAPYATKISGFFVLFFAALLTAIAPPVWVFMMMWAFITLHIFYFSLELSVLAGLLLLCLILFYVRIFPKESYLIILLLICLKINIPYFVPLFCGLFIGVGGVGALVAGVLLWHSMSYIEQFIKAGSTLEDINVLTLPETFALNYKMILEMLSDSDGWVHMAVTFVVVAVCVRVISQMPFNYSMETAILTGAAATAILMTIGTLTGGVQSGILGMALSVIISAALAFVCKFFSILLDYSGTERVTFQDDEYVYYVKAVPKRLKSEL